MTSFRNNVYLIIGKNIKSRRTKLKISQTSIARDLNVSRSTISNIEVGRHQIPIHQLYKLSNLLTTSINDLLPTDEEVNVFNSLQTNLQKIHLDGDINIDQLKSISESIKKI